MLLCMGLMASSTVEAGGPYVAADLIGCVVVCLRQSTRCQYSIEHCWLRSMQVGCSTHFWGTALNPVRSYTGVIQLSAQYSTCEASDQVSTELARTTCWQSQPRSQAASTQSVMIPHFKWSVGKADLPLACMQCRKHLAQDTCHIGQHCITTTDTSLVSAL